jgi:hypothetical protein
MKLKSLFLPVASLATLLSLTAPSSVSAQSGCPLRGCSVRTLNGSRVSPTIIPTDLPQHSQDLEQLERASPQETQLQQLQPQQLQPQQLQPQQTQLQQ